MRRSPWRGYKPVMATRRLLCLCGTLLSRDEREYHAYQCTICVMREHELILAHGRGEDHDHIDALHAGPVDLQLEARLEPRRRMRHSAGAAR